MPYWVGVVLDLSWFISSRCFLEVNLSELDLENERKKHVSCDSSFNGGLMKVYHISAANAMPDTLEALELR